MTYNIRSDAIGWQIPDTFYLMEIVVFALSLAFYEIITNQIKFQKFHLVNFVLGQRV